MGIESTQQERIDNDESNWEVGGDYEYSFANSSRLAVLFVTNNEVRNSIRERLIADPSTEPLAKNLFIDSQRERNEFIVQSNYNFSLSAEQSVRIGFERAITELDSAFSSPVLSVPSRHQISMVVCHCCLLPPTQERV